MQPGMAGPEAVSRPPVAPSEIEFVVDVRVERRAGEAALIVVKQRVRLESAQIAPVGDPREEVRRL
jgi:hypothetical protein